jgi:hypothetical protein
MSQMNQPMMMSCRPSRRASARTIPALALLALLALAIPAPAAAQADTLLLTPAMQGTVHLPESGVTLALGYGTVQRPARLAVTAQDDTVHLRATGQDGAALRRFELPLVVTLPDGVTTLAAWPGRVAPLRAGRWLVVFDAHGVYAQPAEDAAPDDILYLGPLEHFSPELVQPDPALADLTYRDLPTPADSDHYRDRFLPEVRSNPGAFRVLGWTDADALPALALALHATIPDDPDLPAPGVPQAPLRLILPFDCAAVWAVSWGYHHSTPQNRFAVDFAALTPRGTAGQGVYAAHAGTLHLKRYGTPDHLIDVGFSARVVAVDGITSTVYGHLDPAATLALWGVDAAAVPDFAWVEVGPVRQGQMIAIAGGTGYATGPHVHFALWAWDQSLYQPVPLGPLMRFTRGMQIPPGVRQDCARYGR